mgnify:CR=1 FL=1
MVNTFPCHWRKLLLLANVTKVQQEEPEKKPVPLLLPQILPHPCVKSSCAHFSISSLVTSTTTIWWCSFFLFSYLVLWPDHWPWPHSFLTLWISLVNDSRPQLKTKVHDWLLLAESLVWCFWIFEGGNLATNFHWLVIGAEKETLSPTLIILLMILFQASLGAAVAPLLTTMTIEKRGRKSKLSSWSNWQVIGFNESINFYTVLYNLMKRWRPHCIWFSAVVFDHLLMGKFVVFFLQSLQPQLNHDQHISNLPSSTQSSQQHIWHTVQ